MKKILIAFYNLGAGVGVVGMGVGVGVLLWTFSELVIGLVGRGQGSIEVVKRAVETTTVGRTSLLHPIVSLILMQALILTTLRS